MESTSPSLAIPSTSLKPQPRSPAGPLEKQRTSSEWVCHFEENEQRQAEMAWDEVFELNPTERRAISQSIAVFQLGESSEGLYFKAAGARYAATHDDSFYPQALDLFIAEENRHAAYLGRFMRRHGIAFKESEWTDSVFRAVRRLAGLEISVSVLITAELIATVYYRGLREATRSVCLRRICNQILKDEDEHLLFQAGVLGKMRRGHGPVRRWFTRWLSRGFMAGTLVVVWTSAHRRVLRAGGIPFTEYVRDTWRELERCLRLAERGAELPASNFAATSAGTRRAKDSVDKG